MDQLAYHVYAEPDDKDKENTGKDDKSDVHDDGYDN